MVVSPLISLVQDQVSGLCKSPRPADCAAAWTSNTSAVTKGWIEEQYGSAETGRLQQSALRLLYVTPEGLSRNGRLHLFLRKLHASGHLRRFIVDEAHCIVSWGSGFRPDYRRLSCLRVDYPGTPVVAMTATAAPDARVVIRNVLGMTPNTPIFVGSLNRSNLMHTINVKTADVIAQMVRDIRRDFARESGIIFCLSRQDTETVCAKLTSTYGLSAVAYHAGLATDDKRERLAAWTSGEKLILVSTCACSMGIDKSDVRFVFHHAMPDSMESYIQESGRAGRDGNFSSCVLYFASHDRVRQTALVVLANGGDGTEAGASSPPNMPTDDNSIRRLRALNAITRYATETVLCRRKLMLESLGEDPQGIACVPPCDNCSARAVQGGGYGEANITLVARQLLMSIETISGRVRCTTFVTVKKVIDFYSGRTESFRRSNCFGVHKWPGFGYGATRRQGFPELDNGELYRVVEQLVASNIVLFHASRAEAHHSFHGCLHTNGSSPAYARLFATDGAMKTFVRLRVGKDKRRTFSEETVICFDD